MSDSFNLPPLNALKAFEASARLQSITLAAKELHVTHGAVSRQVKQLEEHLGITLLSKHAPMPVCVSISRVTKPLAKFISLAWILSGKPNKRLLFWPDPAP